LQPELTEPFKANPFFFSASTGLAVAAGVIALLALVSLFRKPKVAIVLGALAALVSLGAFGFGLLGRTLAVSRVDGAASAPKLTDADRARITTTGYAEARVCLVHGALVSVLPLVGGIGVAAAAIARARRARARGAIG
jgi:hypothetical protein